MVMGVIPFAHYSKYIWFFPASNLWASLQRDMVTSATLAHREQAALFAHKDEAVIKPLNALHAFA